MDWFLVWVIAFVTAVFVFWALTEIARLRREYKERIIEYLTHISALVPQSPPWDYAKANKMAYGLMLECSKKDWLEIRGAVGDCIPYLCNLCGHSNHLEVTIWHLPGGEKEADRRIANAAKKRARHH